MRLSVALLMAAACAVLGGAWLAGGLLGLGVALAVTGVALGAYALLRDSPGRAAPTVTGVPTLQDVLDRARQAP